MAFDIPNSPPLGPHGFLDTYLSLLISAWNYIRGSKDHEWLNWDDDMLSARAACCPSS